MEEGYTGLNGIACRIKQEPLDDMVDGRHSSKQILVNLGLGRKKVLIVHSGSTLVDQLKDHIHSDPAFSVLLNHSFPVLQEFNEKFETWVDIDSEENLKDGAVLKAVFFPKRLETDETNPQSIKRKREDSDSALKYKRRCIRPAYVEKNSSSCDISSQFNQVKSEISLPCSQPKVVCKRKENKKTTKEIELVCNNGSNIKPPENTIAKPMKKLAHNVKNCLNSPQNDVSVHALTVDLNKNQCGSTQANVVKVFNGVVETCDTKHELPISSAEVQCVLREPNTLKPIMWNPYPQGRKSSIRLQERLKWGTKAKNRKEEFWLNHMFTDICAFVLEGNRIKRDSSRNRSREVFWGCITSKGPQILVNVGRFFRSSDVIKLLNNEVNCFLRERKECQKRIFFQVFASELFRYIAKEVRELKLFKSLGMSLRVWPSSARNISPVEHAWRIVEEKVKNVHCSSKEHMISIISKVWMNDVDLQLMCEKYILSIPEIITSVIKQEGGNPNIEITW